MARGNPGPLQKAGRGARLDLDGRIGAPAASEQIWDRASGRCGPPRVSTQDWPS